MANALLNLRYDPSTVEGMTIKNEESCKEFSNASKLYELVHWKDTLIGKGKKDFLRDKYDYKRIVAVGDVHGDFDKFVKILRHAKLIDEENNWIGTDAILVQVVNIKYIYIFIYF